ncbi:type VI secretion system tube protein TssD [Kluyvera intermedia]|uniref:Type VI secretion system tube protein Hcp n=1 Tax=Kluyvera intermedia TaxID=61648 RepID=A0ABX6DWS9_KLUIN|nr:type VI secretion system tube protein TssD [Kluyvera intermedia]QGH32020.1 type VI secretion system tube protein Hcp [Kluyvera intermedia]QGH41002.1 type VI secretion system tube protein Hcp [Kluyvera intermedia]
MSDIIYLRVTGETQGNISPGCGTYASVGNRWQHGHEDEIFSFSLTHALRGTGKEINLEGLRFQKLIDKSTPLFINAITNNERLFIEIDFWRINRTGRWERYYYIELRNASVIDIHTRITLNDLPTEDISVAYDYIQYKHLIANTAFDYLAFHAEYNHLFIPRRAQAPAPPKPAPVKPPSPPAPKVTPVYAKSCLKEKGCTDAGSAEEPAKNFGQMAIFTQPIVDDCCGYAHPDEATVATLTLGALTQISGEWSLSGALGAARAIPWIGALASALYVPSAGKGSDRVPGRDEFWYEEELRKKALAGGTATTRVRFFWGTDIHGKPQIYGVHTGEGTPYENVRVANMVWNADTQRYEFTPAHGVDGPLITWTPGKPQNGDVPAHTGNQTAPIDQPTILVNPIPEGQGKYTTPPLPVPDVADFNDYILIFPADSGIQPIYVYLKDDPRDQPGTAIGNGVKLTSETKWLDMSATNEGNGAPIPAHIADKLRGKNYSNFRAFREDLWREVQKDPVLSKEFSTLNLSTMVDGKAPISPRPGHYEGPKIELKKFEIHHVKPIEKGGGIYDIDNLRITTPKFHKLIHYGKVKGDR